jgi:hypothetical protein
MTTVNLKGNERFDRSWVYSPALYIEAAGKDARLSQLDNNPDFALLKARLASTGNTVFVARAQLYHYAELTGFLLPVGSSIGDTTARMVLYRLNGPTRGPRSFLFEIQGAIGADSRLTPHCLQSLTIASASGQNSLTLRPIFRQDRGSYVQIIKLKTEHKDEDEGFWSALGDFLTGVGEFLGDLFGTIWDWLKETAKDLFDEILRGDASARGVDEDGDGRTDAIIVFKIIRF